MLFLCSYCAAHVTVPATDEDEIGVSAEDLVLDEDCDIMIAAEVNRKEAAAPADVGDGNPWPKEPAPDDAMDPKHV
eukprot:14816553-Alexandrium_andersonii.AAC.1